MGSNHDLDYRTKESSDHSCSSPSLETPNLASAGVSPFSPNLQEESPDLEGEVKTYDGPVKPQDLEVIAHIGTGTFSKVYL
mmetsp:Transcript_4958/g.5841  ORF Transcript_4958/g.5841 Transcript_4958/m.5841 type:complete len:81 (+) Transcript_4958:9-251(+)